ncbi:MAG: L-rhamnose mutarotase [Bacteroidales bacterium]|nr:L-rhamnose mutarotase [Bacteroidales bacterium]
MNELENGYPVRKYKMPIKRYCQTLTLNCDNEKLEKYISAHSPQNIWKEIPQGIKQVGILNMEIFIDGHLLFMIVETPIDFDWNVAMKKLAQLPRQAEWEAYVALLQGVDPSATSDEKWKLMKQIFSL